MPPTLECLTEKELQLVGALKQEVASIVQAHPALQCFCIDWTYVRYLHARSWDLQKATKMLKATLEWRLQYKPELIRWEDIQEEACSGKQLITREVDNEGRPVMLLRPRLENTKPNPNQLKLVVYTLERASRLADELGITKLNWLVDFEGYSLRNAPPVKTSLDTLHTLQNHYPERLGAAICYHSPRLFSMTWAAVSPFIDKVTAKKIHFVNKGDKGEAEQMAALFNMEHMDASLGGSSSTPMFSLEEYKQRMTQVDEQVAQQLAQVAAGGSRAPSAEAVIAVDGSVGNGKEALVGAGAPRTELSVVS